MNPGIGNHYLRVGIGRPATADKETGEILETLPYFGPLWLIWTKNDEPFMIIPLPQQYWMGAN